MATKHEVYPGDMARTVEDEADRLGTSVSGLYKEAMRAYAQNPDSPLNSEEFPNGGDE